MFESINTPNSPNWALRIAIAATIIVLAAGAFSIGRMISMPLQSYRGSLPQMSSTQSELANRLEEHVRHLAATIGERSIYRTGSLRATTDYLGRELAQSGYSVLQQSYAVEGVSVSNLEVDLQGTENSGEVVVGAHYDSVAGTVGADDNASGVAATLELARVLRGSKPRRMLRFVFFVNEEPPFFQTQQMGSLVYAQKLRRDSVPVSVMISLETIGFYSDAPGSQNYPSLLSLFYPSRGNFIGFVANSESRELVRSAVRTFRKAAMFPSEGVAAPANWPGIGWSDQWSFWQAGYPAIMITDTATFRYPYYHSPRDTPEKIDFDKMARVVDGVRSVVLDLANAP